MDPNNFTCTYSQAAHAYMWGHVTTQQMSEGMRCPHLNFLSKISPKGKFNQNTSITAISARLAEPVGCPMTATSDEAPLTGTLLLSNFQWGTLIWYLLFDNFRRGTFNWYLDFFFSNFQHGLLKRCLRCLQQWSAWQFRIRYMSPPDFFRL